MLRASPAQAPLNLWSCADALPAPSIELRVLASSSSGNCSVLIHGEGALRRVTLIDCGLSPLRTRGLLARLGLDFSAIDEVLVTHFDGDHFHGGWARRLPPHVRLMVHRAHAARAASLGVPAERATVYDRPIDLRCGARATPTMLSHDALGVAAFRIEFGGASLGYATDLGRVTSALVDALAGVDVLAIESNYCPELQRASPRPEFLKRRIMDGSGHLSNEQCADGVEQIGPRSHVVLLHLSRECNTPGRAAAGHRGRGYGLSIASPDEPSDAVRLGR